MTSLIIVGFILFFIVLLYRTFVIFFPTKISYKFNKIVNYSTTRNNKSIPVQIIYPNWLSYNTIHQTISKFHETELMRDSFTSNDVNKQSSLPFITSHTIRIRCLPNWCEPDEIFNDISLYSNIVPPIKRCNFRNLSIANRSCVYVNALMLKYFVEYELPLIHSSIKIFTDHAGDQSNPDGQLLRNLNLNKWLLSDKLQHYHDYGILHSLHSVNLHWRGSSKGVAKPSWAHCVPIGLENRNNRFGNKLSNYVQIMQQQLRISSRLSPLDRLNDSLLLLDFKPGEYSKPDRTTAAINLLSSGWTFNGYGNKNWKAWMSAIARHKFTLAPHGHGLDTHRMMEILLMGGIPVIKRSSITSCYDDSDNILKSSSRNTLYQRGSLPIVVVNDWREVTKDRLINEWTRISSFPPDHWDWRRLFAEHWIERLDFW